MRTPRLSPPAILLAVALTCSPSWAILVDCNGGGDYLTIQEGVDAASPIGDIVWVAPGVYTDTHIVDVFGSDKCVNVFFEKGITLQSLGGPEITIIDGGGIAQYGVLALPYDLGVPGIDPFPPIVEGFTVRNGMPWDSVGIVALGGEARGNIATGHNYGLATGFKSTYAGIPDGGRSREQLSLIAGNTATGNHTGIRISSNDEGFVEALVSENTITGNNWGVRVSGPSNRAQLVGNEICQNETGVFIMPGGSTQSGVVDIEFLRNTIAHNTTMNIRVYNEWSWDGYCVTLTLGGSPEDANDIHDSPRNLQLVNQSVLLDVDARYNYWGSAYCDEFVPLFYTSGVPDTCFTFLPYVDEAHATVYEECQYTTVQNLSWGAIKAMFR